MSKLVFPEGFNPNYIYTVPADFIPDYVVLSNTNNLYRNSNNTVIDVQIDTSNVTSMRYMFSVNSTVRCVTYFDTSNATDMSYMFQNCSKLITIPHLNTDNVTDMTYMFSYCSKLIAIPHLNTSKVTNMSNIFYECDSLTNIPHLNTSKVTTMNYMFYGCDKLKSIPELDFSNVTGIGSMFYGCASLTELPNINCKKLTSFSNWLYNCGSLTKIGVIDCDSVTNMQYIIAGAQNIRLTDIGGFRNLGMKSSISNTNGNYALYYAPNLTRQSLLNVFNLLYDRASAGYSVLTLKLHPNHLAKLTDDDIAIATNKGWSIA